MRVLVDENKCCGAGQCVMIAPRVFDQRDDGIVILLDESPPKELHPAVREAACVCPGAAIVLEE
ncbi:ferredoxin [Nannocystis punicea]|uniref:Ferredoxin n=1 Tax=Nannocystis punicea TaxID=2995304 RepID=A0ABY7GWP0_9BACT|nr:ferredoxin [Nannocystis poenicansa]WAS91315.1 ferredoxin [Nannocystis poenicansa]